MHLLPFPLPSLRKTDTLTAESKKKRQRERDRMDENHQDRIESKPIATKDDLWLPPFSLKGQRKLKHFQKKPFAVRVGLKGKTLWDWLNLLAALAIPLVVVGVTVGFGWWQGQLTQQQNQASERAAATRYANDQQLAADQQQETILKTYLDDMSNLLLNYKLLESQQPRDTVRQVARERTLTVLRRLHAKRNGIVLQFLQDTGLIREKNAIINFNDADLSNDDLRGTNLIGANLSGANLDSAIITTEQLATVNSLEDATLPDGTKHP